ncbi:MAG: carbohydrate transporter rane protein 1, family, partial [Bacteroidetes bacterium]|nr:carbohydrate transporter rane protein 1, family [Bacteroidota bacterium]
MKFLWRFDSPRHQSQKTGYWFILPYAVFFGMFVAYPLVFSFVLLFHRWNVVTPMEWIGLKNFARLLSDPLFFKAIVNTLKFLLIHIPLQMVVALGLAVLLNSRLKFRGFFRAVFFLPVVVSGVVVTILWQQLYAFDSGLLNRMLSAVGIGKIPWLIDPDMAMLSIALMATWKNVGIYI